MATVSRESLRLAKIDLAKQVGRIFETEDEACISRAAAALNDVRLEYEADPDPVLERCRHFRPTRSCPWCRRVS